MDNTNPPSDPAGQSPTPTPVPPASPIPSGGAPTPGPGISDKQWRTYLYLSPLLGLIVPAGGAIAPLVIRLTKKDTVPSLDADGRAVLNFQISVFIYSLVTWVLAIFASCLIIPIVLPFAVYIFWLVYTILAAVKVSNGENPTFPLTIKML